MDKDYIANRLNAHLEQQGSCLVFTGATNQRGYGRLGTIFGSNKLSQAHRVAYELKHGKIPAGMIVRHKCDNPPCCNPDHLELGNNQENSNDMKERGRSKTGETHPNAKLSKVQVDEIRTKYTSGNYSQAILACEYSVNQQQISRIVNNKRWTKE